MRVEDTAVMVAVVSKYDVKNLKVVKSDKRGKMTLEDDSEWNARTGRRWGAAKANAYSYSFKPYLTTVEDGQRTAEFRAAQKAMELRHAAYKEGVARITAALHTYYANDMEMVKEKIAEARMELDKLEKEFA